MSEVMVFKEKRAATIQCNKLRYGSPRVMSSFRFANKHTFQKNEDFSENRHIFDLEA